jgi:hypothetical protein
MAYVNDGWSMIHQSDFGDGNVMPNRIILFADFIRQCRNMPAYFRSGASEGGGSIFNYDAGYTSTMKDYIGDICREVVEQFTSAGISMPADVSNWVDDLLQE